MQGGGRHSKSAQTQLVKDAQAKGCVIDIGHARELHVIGQNIGQALTQTPTVMRFGF